MTVLQHWTLRRITGGSGTISHPWWTTAPAAPKNATPPAGANADPTALRTLPLLTSANKNRKNKTNDRH